MAQAVSQHVWTRQPGLVLPIAKTKLTDGLASFIAVGGGENFLDYASGFRPSADSSVIQRGQYGQTQRQYNGSVNTQFANRAAYQMASANGSTIIMIFDLDSGGSYNCVASAEDSTTSSGWECRVGSGSGDTRLLAHRASSSGQYSQWVASGFVDQLSFGSKDNFWSVSFADNVIGTAPVYNVNGTAIVATNATGGSYTSVIGGSSGPLYIANRQDTVTPFAGSVKTIIIYNRGLAFEDTDRIRKNPWQLIQGYEELTGVADVAFNYQRFAGIPLGLLA